MKRLLMARTALVLLLASGMLAAGQPESGLVGY
jgi:hypothetical protein